ncbi:YhgE/Pip domain-containing protein [Streptomyces sp. NBC_01431]|uniref:YhgE/Pip domain-containing protein n=1 Tax=Streptomyces sp. NBC_01431 TaxID=2903863 RepID=UPI002E30C5B6|nr:YhgE/Pip domain-containing protein [Streptomyces sp. NBC_01431]
MRSPRLAALELKRFGRGKLPRAALVALLLLPLLYGALYLCSFWDPYSRLDRIPVALVNEDKGASAAGQQLHAGDEISKKLLDSKTFEWHEVGAAEAGKGLEDGKYYLSLTMPADFSKRIASSSGDSPETGALQVRTNDANNYIVGSISRTVFSEVRAAASTKASRSFLDKIFISFADLHDATEKAAKGAGDLKDGLGKAKDGSKSLADGLKDAKDGSGKLAGGISALDTGAGTLASGAQQVADGTQQIADEANGVAGKARPYLKDNGKTVADSAKLLADSIQPVRDNLAEIIRLAPAATAGTRQASKDLDALYQQLCVDTLTPGAVCPKLNEAKKAMATGATLTEDVNNLVKDQGGDFKKLNKSLGDLQTQARDLAAKAPSLSGDLEKKIADINKLNKGAHDVAKGAADIHAGLGTASTGSTDLDKGVGKLKKGAGALDGGILKLSDGSVQLATGLHDGVGQIPDYDKRARDQRTDVMSDPVKLASQAVHKAPNYGTGFAPYFIPLSLWVGAMVAYMLIQPLNRRALAAGASAWRIAFAGWLPVAAVGVLQIAALMSVLHFGLGLEMQRTAGTLGYLALTSCCFAAIVQWLNAKFGAAGRILVLAALMLQLTSAGGTYPVQTSPAFFNAIHPYLPMSYVVDGLRRLITGGDLGVVWQGCAVLAAFTVGALALTALSARQKQVWSLDRLHPELSL